MKLKILFCASSVFLATVLCWMRGVDADFVELDDFDYVYQNPHVRDGLSLDGVCWAFTDCGYASNWHPLCWMSLMGDVSLLRTMEKIADAKTGSWFSPRDDWRPGAEKAWTGLGGRLPRLMHAHNLLLHAFNSVLLFLILLRLWRLVEKPTKMSFDGLQDSSIWQPLFICAMLALLWSVHPLRAEVVCWVSERKEVLSVFYMLLSLIMYFSIPANECGTVSRTQIVSFVLRVLSILFFALALLAKPVAVTMPAVVFAWDWVVRRERFWKAGLRSIPFAVLSSAVCVLTLMAQKESIETGKWTKFSNRITYIFDAPVIYLRQTLFPRGLSAYYSEIDSPHWIGAGLGIALVIVLAWLCIRWILRREEWTAACTFGTFWAYLGLLPMLGVVRVANQPHSDRYTYWVGCGCAATVLLLLRTCEKGLTRRSTLGMFLLSHGRVWVDRTLIVCVIACALVSQKRIDVWHDTISLFRDAVPKCWSDRITGAFANHVKRMGPIGRQEAEAVLRETVARNPCALAFANLGNFLVGGQDGPELHLSEDEKAFPEARYWADRALRMEPNCGLAYTTLGCADMKNKSYASAVRNFERALECGEDNSTLVNGLPHWRKLAEDEIRMKQSKNK